MWLDFRLFLVALRLLCRDRRDVLLENLARRQQLAVFQRRGRNLTLEEWERFLPPGEPYRATCEQWPIEPGDGGAHEARSPRAVRRGGHFGRRFPVLPLPLALAQTAFD